MAVKSTRYYESNEISIGLSRVADDDERMDSTGSVILLLWDLWEVPSFSFVEGTL